MPENPFIEPTPYRNAMIPCFKFPDIAYYLWKDRHYDFERRTESKTPIYRPKYAIPSDPPSIRNHYGNRRHSNQYHYQYHPQEHYNNDHNSNEDNNDHHHHHYHHH